MQEPRHLEPGRSASQKHHGPERAAHTIKAMCAHTVLNVLLYGAVSVSCIQFTCAPLHIIRFDSVL